MEKNRIILQIAMLFMSVGLYAANGDRSLVVLLKSGTMISVPVSEQPHITFDGTVMRVGDGDYQIANVRKWMIGTEEEIALSIDSEKRSGAIVYRDGVLSVGNRKDVHVWNSAGMKMPLRLKNGQVDMTTWPQDVYVVKAGNETLKLRKP